MTTSNDGDSAGRLFIGVPVADAARGAVDAALRRAVPEGLPGRAVPVANWHLTLRFLGATRAEQHFALREHLRAADLGAPFDVRFGGLGAFPRPRSARVLWAAVTDGAERLRALAAAAEDAARAAGFAAERKRWTPHLTLSRIQPPRDVTRIVEMVPPLGGRRPVPQPPGWRPRPLPGRGSHSPALNRRAGRSARTGHPALGNRHLAPRVLCREPRSCARTHDEITTWRTTRLCRTEKTTASRPGSSWTAATWPTAARAR